MAAHGWESLSFPAAAISPSGSSPHGPAFGIRSGFAADVSPQAVDVRTNFGIDGVIGLLLILLLLYAADRFM